MKNKIMILTLLVSLMSSLMARDTVDLLQNKRVNLMYGLVLLNRPAVDVEAGLKVTSVNVFSYSRDNEYYFGLGIDNYSGISPADTYLQVDNSAVAGMMLGEYINFNAGFGISTVSAETPTAFLVTNANLFFLDIAVFTVKANYYLSTSAANLSMLMGLTF